VLAIFGSTGWNNVCDGLSLFTAALPFIARFRHCHCDCRDVMPIGSQFQSLIIVLSSSGLLLHLNGVTLMAILEVRTMTMVPAPRGILVYEWRVCSKPPPPRDSLLSSPLNYVDIVSNWSLRRDILPAFCCDDHICRPSVLHHF
jgi:hypothetical protein